MTDELKEGAGASEATELVNKYPIFPGGIKEVVAKQEPEPIETEVVSHETIQFKADSQVHDYVAPEAKDGERMVSIPESELVDLASGRQATINRRKAAPPKVSSNMKKEIIEGIAEGLSKTQPRTEQPADPLNLFDADEKAYIKQVFADGSDDEKAQLKMQINNRRASALAFNESQIIKQDQETFQQAVLQKSEMEMIASINSDVPIDNKAAYDAFLAGEGFDEWVTEYGQKDVPRETAYRLFKSITGKTEGESKMPAHPPSGDVKEVSQEAARKVAQKAGTSERGTSIGRDTSDKDIRESLSRRGLKKSVKDFGVKAAQIYNEARGLKLISPEE